MSHQWRLNIGLLLRLAALTLAYIALGGKGVTVLVVCLLCDAASNVERQR